MYKKIMIIMGSLFLILFSAQNLYSNELFNFQKNNIYKAKVVRVIDGDTIILKPLSGDIEYQEERARLIGVDTPETVHPRKKIEFFGSEASTFTKTILTEYDIVYIQTENQIYDTYGRLLIYLWLKKPDDINNENEVITCMLNSILLSEGYGQKLIIRPNNKYKKLFSELQEHAKKNKIGMWQMN